MAVHEPRRGVEVLGTTPKVHRGFYHAWMSKGLDQEIMDHIQVGPGFRVRGSGFSPGGSTAFSSCRVPT